MMRTPPASVKKVVCDWDDAWFPRSEVLNATVHFNRPVQGQPQMLLREPIDRNLMFHLDRDKRVQLITEIIEACLSQAMRYVGRTRMMPGWDDDLRIHLALQLSKRYTDH